MMPLCLPKPQFLSMSYIFVFSSSQKSRHHLQLFLHPIGTEPLPTDPYIRCVCSSSILSWIYLHLSIFLSPSNPTIFIWTKLFTLDLLFLLCIAARMVPFRHKSDDGTSFFEELHGSLSSGTKFRTCYHDPQACKYGSCLPCWSLHPNSPSEDKALGTPACFVFLAYAIPTLGLWYSQYSLPLVHRELCKHAAYASCSMNKVLRSKSLLSSTMKL